MADEKQQQPTETKPVEPIALQGDKPPEGDTEKNIPGSEAYDGVDRPQLEPRNFLGFPIFDEAPTHEDIEGRVVLFDDATRRAIYVFLSAAWRHVALVGGSGYAEVYGSTDITVTMTNANQYYTIAGGSNGAEMLLDADASNYRILVPATAKGVYKATFTLTFTLDTAADLRAGVLVDSAEQANLVSIVQVANTGQEYTMTVSGLLDFTGITAQKTVTGRIQTPTAGAVATVKRYNLTLHAVG